MTVMTCPHCGHPIDLPESEIVADSMKPQVLRAQAREILDRLNELAGTHYRPVAVNIDMIVSRLKEGYTPQDLGQIIVSKVREWGKDDKMRPFLRPATLFNRRNAAQYVGQLGGINVQRA